VKSGIPVALARCSPMAECSPPQDVVPAIVPWATLLGDQPPRSRSGGYGVGGNKLRALASRTPRHARFPVAMVCMLGHLPEEAFPPRCDLPFSSWT